MREYNIRAFGAVADGKTNNAEKIQEAIDACTAGGGGRVSVSGGTYLTGMIELRANVELHIEADGVLLASPRHEDFPEKERRHVDAAKLSRFSAAAMIFAEECENISITGEGKIDGNGYAYVTPCEPYHCGWNYKRKDNNTLPRLVFFTGCKNIRVEDVAVVDAPAGWCFWIHDCDFVNFERVRILCEPTLPNVDGIHINSSRDVTVSGCDIRTGDDCIVVRAANRSLRQKKICERVKVSDCTLKSHTNAIRIGWVGDGVIRDCAFSDLVMDETRTGIGIWLPPASIAFSDNTPETSGKGGSGNHGLGASLLESTHIENISFSDITMKNIYRRPIEIEIDPSEQTPANAVQDISFFGIRAEALGFPKLSGRRDCPLKNLHFCGCDFRTVPPERLVFTFDAVTRGITPPSLCFAENIIFEQTTFSSEV